MNTISCVPKEPFIKLDENGKASILNYSLPQNTSYNATAFLSLQIPDEWFKPLERNDFWTELMRKPLEEIKELVLQDIQTVGSVGIFDNIEMINRLNVEITDFSLNLNNHRHY